MPACAPWPQHQDAPAGETFRNLGVHPDGGKPVDAKERRTGHDRHHFARTQLGDHAALGCINRGASLHLSVGSKVRICSSFQDRVSPFRATGITEYLRNGGKLEIAQQMANHESARTTGRYDRRNDQVSLDEVERILFELKQK